MVPLKAAKAIARLRGDEGQATVEFALILPILILLVVGIFEFGRAWNAHQVITDAAREGARTGAIANPAITRDSVKNVVENALVRAALNPNRARITLSGIGEITGVPVSVEVRYPYQFGFLKPFMGWVADQGQITLGATSVMRHE